MLQVEEDKASNVLASINIRRVAEAVDMPHSTVQNNMWCTLRYYPYKLQLLQKFFFLNDFEIRHSEKKKYTSSIENE